MLDTIIITTSFVFDIVFLSDVQGEESEKAAAVVVILLMWRIAHITDSAFTFITPADRVLVVE
jgi:hypothetical protein